jgi:hypothetical protein
MAMRIAMEMALAMRGAMAMVMTKLKEKQND